MMLRQLSLQKHTYVRNNPFYYKDPDGRLVFVIPVLVGAFGAGGIVISGPTVGALVGTGVGTGVGLALGWGAYKFFQDNTDHQVETNDNEQEDVEFQEKKTKNKRGKDNEIKGGPPREPSTANYLPDSNAEGPHTTLGIQQGRKGSYTQGATFDENGKFKGRTDVTNHGRSDHPTPHFHPATGPNSAKSPPQVIFQISFRVENE